MIVRNVELRPFGLAMNRHDASHDVPHGLAPASRKWSVGVVLAIALVLMAAVPLAGRAFY